MKSGGTIEWSVDATVSGVTLSSGATEILYNGGVLSGATIGNGVTLMVEQIQSSGTLLPAGSATNVTVGSGGTIIDAGGAIAGLNLKSGSVEYVIDGGVVSGTTISRGATLVVSNQGFASAVTVLGGGTIVYDGGRFAGITVSSGGTEIVKAGTTVNGITVGTGASLIVSSGAAAINIALSGGTETVAAGGLIGGTVDFAAKAKLSVAGPIGDTLMVTGFAAGDSIDLATYGFSSTTKFTFKENASKTAGVLSITAGTLKASITLFGQYVATGFKLASDKGAGTTITYVAPSPAHTDLAINHR